LLYVVLLMEGLLQFFFFYGDGIKKNAEWWWLVRKVDSRAVHFIDHSTVTFSCMYQVCSVCWLWLIIFRVHSDSNWGLHQLAQIEFWMQRNLIRWVSYFYLRTGSWSIMTEWWRCCPRTNSMHHTVLLGCQVFTCKGSAFFRYYLLP
jgi:hypothetical protein